MTLSNLKRIELRKEWADEARDFTPWLSSEKGLAMLGELLGMELELEDTEVRVGSYRADIVAKDSLSEQYVVIENQLEPTNHDHIGKLFTYAASFGASSLVWIAEKFREEHRQAIDWFNDVTVKDVDFFGIEIELLQIGDSPYAPNFKIVSKPNEWTRSIRASKQKLTAWDSTRLEYWTAFNEYINSNNVKINNRKPHTGHWYDVAMGISGAHFTFTMRGQKQDIACELYIDGADAKELFQHLEADANEIEKIIGGEMEWHELPTKKASRIIFREKIDPADESKWHNAFEWYSMIIRKFREAFTERVKGF
ncbi:MAG: DUF4268 domain-containing protein [Bacteroidetes bacterium]|jgi:hypothetical protein|nr:DUF4268 domain-containing protein [Bacteroidota bacterium]